MSVDPFRETFLRDVLKRYQEYKRLGERALAQVADDDLHQTIDADANSMAIIVRHLEGNLRSRFTDFLTTDGEKPDRNRDGEFEPTSATREELLRGWESAWTIALKSIAGLQPADLDRTITIGGQPHLVVEALERLLTHAAYHVGQLVLLAKHFAGDRWTTLTIPRKKRES